MMHGGDTVVPPFTPSEYSAIWVQMHFNRAFVSMNFYDATMCTVQEITAAASFQAPVNVSECAVQGS